jgi:hypothetical protein
MTDYVPVEQLAAKIIASLIYVDWPSGPDLDTDPAQLGLYAPAVMACRDPYDMAAITMPQDGILRDCHGDAATAWEGLRQMTGAATPYARIDPLIRELGGAITLPPPPKPARAKSGGNGVKPDYVLSEPGEMPESALIMERLKTLGYAFRLNLCSDSIEVNGRKISDVTAAEIRTALRDIGLAKKITAAEDAYVAAAKKNAYHPIHDYLNSLKWDGADHISKLTSYMESSDPPIVYRDGTLVPLHAVYLYRWLIGAVAKALDAHQLAMLVLDSVQDLGKSTLARWLCSGMPDYFIESAINLTDKDSDVRLIDRWIWEVAELDATTRKADQSALKNFITKKEVTVRKAYGRYEITKSAMAALIGTLNNSTGFLTDDTGNRRFLITRLTRLDFHYETIDVNQLWGQAVQLYRDGEPWKLVGEEKRAQNETNKRYEVESTITDWLDKYFVFDPAAQNDDQWSLADIIRILLDDHVPLSGSERTQAMELARILSSKGAAKIHTDQGNRWVGFYKR